MTPSEGPVFPVEVGAKFGPSHWFRILQEDISKFGEATNDLDPMHVLPDWAQSNSPFGVTLAFGFQTMGLMTHLLHDARRSGPIENPKIDGHFLNYGFERLRLIEPVRVNDRIRGDFKITGLENRGESRWLIKLDAHVGIEKRERPAILAQWLILWLAPA